MSAKKEITSIGGQAVMEGVMMRGKNMYAMAVRRPDNGIEMITQQLSPIGNKIKILKLPILRGVVSFVESMILGVKITMQSSEIAISAEEENYEPSKFEKFLINALGSKLNDIILYTSLCLSVVLAMGLFTFLPVWLTSFLRPLTTGHTWLISSIEGILKITIFICYMLLISRSKEIQRVFQYHGAEHKTINCFESGSQLTVENVMKHTRFHKRCGTSFLIIVMLISIFVFIFVKSEVVWIRFGLKLLFIPLIAGISYEFIRLAGKSDSFFVRIVSYPGICLQKITTSEPDASQIEVAIAAVTEVLKNDNK